MRRLINWVAFSLAVLPFGTASGADAVVAETDWGAYLGDQGRRHYSPLTQISRDNVGNLKIAWTYDSGEVSGGESVIYTSPLVKQGVLFGLSARSVAFALEASSGRELWRYDPGVSGPQRGLMWWQRGNEKRLFYTASRFLIALNPDSGEPIETFGDNGRLELHAADAGFFSVSTPGAVIKDLLILGSRVGEGEGSLAGVISARSVIDGRLIWEFRGIPRPGEPGADTWPEDAWQEVGGANNWAGMTLDEDRQILFVPTGSATPDFYGGGRHGDNLYANTLLALNANTGRLLWHRQLVRHDLWDRDLPAPPTLVELQRDGRVIRAVAQPTKSGDLFLFDRMDGASLYPMIDVPAPPSSIPGERAASHQLESAVTFTRRRFHPTTRSAEAKRFVENLLQPLDQRRWAPPSLQGALLYPAYDGGAEWGGAAFNPASNQLVVNAQEVGGIVRLYEFARGESAAATYALQCGGCHGMDLGGTDAGPALKGVADRLSISEIFAVVASGRGRMPGFSTLPREQLSAVIGHLFNPAEVDETVSGETQYGFAGYTVIRDPDGLPGNQPPWGTLSAIDLASGDTVWRVALGDYPGYEGRGWGAENYGGPVVTAAGLIFIAATPDARLRAFDASTGAELWSGKLPHAGFATPSVYAVDGRQYVVIAAGGGKLGQASGSQYVAFALPR